MLNRKISSSGQQIMLSEEECNKEGAAVVHGPINFGTCGDGPFHKKPASSMSCKEVLNTVQDGEEANTHSPLAAVGEEMIKANLMLPDFLEMWDDIAFTNPNKPHLHKTDPLHPEEVLTSVLLPHGSSKHFFTAHLDVPVNSPWRNFLSEEPLHVSEPSRAALWRCLSKMSVLLHQSDIGWTKKIAYAAMLLDDCQPAYKGASAAFCEAMTKCKPQSEFSKNPYLAVRMNDMIAHFIRCRNSFAANQTTLSVKNVQVLDDFLQKSKREKCAATITELSSLFYVPRSAIPCFRFVLESGRPHPLVSKLNNESLILYHKQWKHRFQEHHSVNPAVQQKLTRQNVYALPSLPQKDDRSLPPRNDDRSSCRAGNDVDGKRAPVCSKHEGSSKPKSFAAKIWSNFSKTAPPLQEKDPRRNDKTAANTDTIKTTRITAVADPTIEVTKGAPGVTDKSKDNDSNPARARPSCDLPRDREIISGKSQFSVAVNHHLSREQRNNDMANKATEVEICLVNVMNCEAAIKIGNLTETRPEMSNLVEREEEKAGIKNVETCIQENVKTSEEKAIKNLTGCSSPPEFNKMANRKPAKSFKIVEPKDRKERDRIRQRIRHGNATAEEKARYTELCGKDPSSVKKSNPEERREKQRLYARIRSDRATQEEKVRYTQLTGRDPSQIKRVHCTDEGVKPSKKDIAKSSDIADGDAVRTKNILVHIYKGSCNKDKTNGYVETDGNSKLKAFEYHADGASDEEKPQELENGKNFSSEDLQSQTVDNPTLNSLQSDQRQALPEKMPHNLSVQTAQTSPEKSESLWKSQVNRTSVERQHSKSAKTTVVSLLDETNDGGKDTPSIVMAGAVSSVDMQRCLELADKIATVKKSITPSNLPPKSAVAAEVNKPENTDLNGPTTDKSQLGNKKRSNKKAINHAENREKRRLKLLVKKGKASQEDKIRYHQLTGKVMRHLSIERSEGQQEEQRTYHHTVDSNASFEETQQYDDNSSKRHIGWAQFEANHETADGSNKQGLGNILGPPPKRPRLEAETFESRVEGMEAEEEHYAPKGQTHVCKALSPFPKQTTDLAEKAKQIMHSSAEKREKLLSPEAQHGRTPEPAEATQYYHHRESQYLYHHHLLPPPPCYVYPVHYKTPPPQQHRYGQYNTHQHWQYRPYSHPYSNLTATKLPPNQQAIKMTGDVTTQRSSSTHPMENKPVSHPRYTQKPAPVIPAPSTAEAKRNNPPIAPPPVTADPIKRRKLNPGGQGFLDGSHSKKESKQYAGKNSDSDPLCHHNCHPEAGGCDANEDEGALTVGEKKPAFSSETSENGAYENQSKVVKTSEKGAYENQSEVVKNSTATKEKNARETALNQPSISSEKQACQDQSVKSANSIHVGKYKLKMAPQSRPPVEDDLLESANQRRPEACVEPHYRSTIVGNTSDTATTKNRAEICTIKSVNVEVQASTELFNTFRDNKDANDTVLGNRRVLKANKLIQSLTTGSMKSNDEEKRKVQPQLTQVIRQAQEAKTTDKTNSDLIDNLMESISALRKQNQRQQDDMQCLLQIIGVLFLFCLFFFFAALVGFD